MGNIQFIPFNEIHNIKPLNGGGFGEIFQATWVNNLGKEKKVALKYLRTSKGFSKNIINEVIPFEITRSDDYILDYYGLMKQFESNKIYIVMEYAEGDIRLKINQWCESMKSEKINDAKKEFHNADKKIIEHEHSYDNDDNTQILQDSWDSSKISEILMSDTLRDSSHLFEILKLDNLPEHSNEK
ncbi:33016_t:CDS:2 [Racocetra persica]|uniref:33016_t:CDS:1 n=1 Tax=Racocetra persica TaxID=160502 RepID=A0ACA9KCV9_9GLOM|nr:33016_t:CDS:2 [Racocetra persica]